MGIRCGTDIVEIDRIRDAMLSCGDSFRERVYTPFEIEYCEQKKAAKYQSYAARFAAKEAVTKALGTGISQGISWKDIEIQNSINGQPQVVLSGKAKSIYEDLKGVCMSVSLSHSGNHAIAYAVIQTSE